MSDPKLILAAGEIKAVLRKHDIAGVMLLQGQKTMEFVREISPSWSCARLVPALDGNGYVVRVRAKREDFPTAAAQKECIENTLGMLIGFQHQATRDAQDMGSVIARVAREVGHVSNFIRQE